MKVNQKGMIIIIFAIVVIAGLIIVIYNTVDKGEPNVTDYIDDTDSTDPMIVEMKTGVILELAIFHRGGGKEGFYLVLSDDNSLECSEGILSKDISCMIEQINEQKSIRLSSEQVEEIIGLANDINNDYKYESDDAVDDGHYINIQYKNKAYMAFYEQIEPIVFKELAKVIISLSPIEIDFSSF